MQTTKTRLFEKTEKKNFFVENSIDFSDLKTDFKKTKQNNLYSSIINAKSVLSEYETDLSTTKSQSGCITPLQESNLLPQLFYKREDLTCIKAYKIRGALYQMKKIISKNPNSDLKFIAASTGNHALGVLKAAEILHAPNVTICISKSVTDFKKQKLENKVTVLREKGVNAQLVLFGETFDETNEFAQNMVTKEENCYYIDPYNNDNAVAGQGTIGVEILEQLQNKVLTSANKNKLKELVVITPIGGGGLISGVSCAIKSGIKEFPLLKNLKLKVVGVRLEKLNSLYGDAIKVKVLGSNNNKYVEQFVDEEIKINDCDMKKGMDFAFADINSRIEGASAGTLKPVLDSLVKPCENRAVVCVLSGGNAVY